MILTRTIKRRRSSSYRSRRENSPELVLLVEKILWGDCAGRPWVGWPKPQMSWASPLLDAEKTREGEPKEKSASRKAGTASDAAVNHSMDTPTRARAVAGGLEECPAQEKGDERRSVNACVPAAITAVCRRFWVHVPSGTRLGLREPLRPDGSAAVAQGVSGQGAKGGIHKARASPGAPAGPWRADRDPQGAETDIRRKQGTHGRSAPGLGGGDREAGHGVGGDVEGDEANQTAAAARRRIFLGAPCR